MSRTSVSFACSLILQYTYSPKNEGGDLINGLYKRIDRTYQITTAMSTGSLNENKLRYNDERLYRSSKPTNNYSANIMHNDVARLDAREECWS